MQQQNQVQLGKLKTDEKQIECYRYNFKKGKLGKGAYGTVYKGINVNTKQQVAIKLVRKSDMKDIGINQHYSDDEKQLLNEISILKSIKNPNIIEIIDVLQTENNYYIILEYCNHGDLESLIYKTHQVTYEDNFQFLIDVLTAFTTLIKQGIMHRDLKPANILVHFENNRKIFKLGDFGFARQISNFKNQIMESKVGTPYYMSPQLLNGQQYTSKSDIWSIGLMLYQIIYQKTPWVGRSENELLHNIIHQPIKFPEIPVINELCKDFILNCLQIKEENRFSWDTLYRHPYISEYFVKFQMQRNCCQKKLYYVQSYLKQKIQNVETLVQLFNKFDTSEDQQLNLEEFTLFIQSLDSSFTDEDVKYIFDEFDKDGNGLVDFEEFKQYLYPSPPKNARLQRSLQQKHMEVLSELSNVIQQYNMSPRQLFRKYDTSNNNSLDKQEMFQLLKKIDLSQCLTLEDIETIINVFDENDDGEIQFDEFKKCLQYIHNEEIFTINSTNKMMIEADDRIQCVPHFNTKINIEELHNLRYNQLQENSDGKLLQNKATFNLCSCNI